MSELNLARILQTGLQARKIMGERLDLGVGHVLYPRGHHAVVVGAHSVTKSLELADRIEAALARQARPFILASVSGLVAGGTHRFLCDFLAFRYEFLIGLKRLSFEDLAGVIIGKLMHVLVGNKQVQTELSQTTAAKA